MQKVSFATCVVLILGVTVPPVNARNVHFKEKCDDRCHDVFPAHEFGRKEQIIYLRLPLHTAYNRAYYLMFLQLLVHTIVMFKYNYSIIILFSKLSCL